MDYALLCAGSSFTVGVAEEEHDTALTHVMADAPEHDRKMAATTTPHHVITARQEQSQVTADHRESSQISAGHPESVYETRIRLEVEPVRRVVLFSQRRPRKCPIRVVLSFLQQRLERRLSPSILKRLWGYDCCQPRPCGWEVGGEA